MSSLKQTKKASNFVKPAKRNKMDIQSTKLQLMQKIMGVTKADLLEKLNMLLDREMIVGYTVNGTALTQEAYNQRLAIAEKQLASGDYTTQEDLEKESENW